MGVIMRFDEWIKTDDTLNARKSETPMYSVNDMRKAYKAGRAEQDLLIRCKDCENSIHEDGKGCAWRSLGNEYCFDGMDYNEACAEITKNFNDFQIMMRKEMEKQL